MNKLRISGIIVAMIGIVGCKSQPSVSPVAKHVHHEHAMEEAVGTPTDMSIYQVESQWTNQRAEVVPLHSLQGKTQLVAMVYTSCQYVCPRIVADMQRIEKALAPGEMNRVGFVLVSIDPKRDVPKRLTQFSTEHHFDPTRWTLLTGSASDVRELAALLGVQYKATGDGEFSHSNLLTVLNAAGEVTYQQRGLGTDPQATIAAIKKTLD